MSARVGSGSHLLRILSLSQFTVTMLRIDITHHGVDPDLHRMVRRHRESCVSRETC